MLQYYQVVDLVRCVFRGTKLVSISILPALLKQADNVAKDEHRTRSELFREAIRSYIDRKQWQKLRQYVSRKAREQGLTEEDVDRLVYEQRHKE